MNDSISDEINIKSDTDQQDDKSRESHDLKRNPYKPIALLFSILMTGTAGWKDLRRSRLKPEQTAAGCFYPLIALASVCRFGDWFYLPEFNLSHTLISAVSVFASLFFSYFAVQVVCKWLFPFVAKPKTETTFFKLMIQYSLSSLALFWIPSELMPILEPITVFLPIWTAFIITKGIRFLRLPEKYVNRCITTIVLTVIVIPYLFLWVCGKIF